MMCTFFEFFIRKIKKNAIRLVIFYRLHLTVALLYRYCSPSGTAGNITLCAFITIYHGSPPLASRRATQWRQHSNHHWSQPKRVKRSPLKSVIKILRSFWAETAAGARRPRCRRGKQSSSTLAVHYQMVVAVAVMVDQSGC